MPNVKTVMLVALIAGVAAVTQPAQAQTTTLTMSSWVSPQHHLTANVLQGWATEVEKATNGRVKFTMLPKHPSAPPGTFDAVRDGLVDLSYVTASYTPARHIRAHRLILATKLVAGRLMKSGVRVDFKSGVRVEFFRRDARNGLRGCPSEKSTLTPLFYMRPRGPRVT